MTKFALHVGKIDFHYKIYTTCGENLKIYTTCCENCHSNVVVTSFSHFQNRCYLSGVSFTTEDISVCGGNYLTMPCGVTILYDTNAVIF